MRKYIDQSHFRTPFRSPNLTLTGLGTPNELLQAWPIGRGYFDVSRFRTPYRDGYFQDNSLFGTESGPPRPASRSARSEHTLSPVAIAALAKDGPAWVAPFVRGDGKAPGTLSANLEATSAQVPQWAWLLAAAAAGYFAYRSYKASKKAK